MCTEYGVFGRGLGFRNTGIGIHIPYPRGEGGGVGARRAGQKGQKRLYCEF